MKSREIRWIQRANSFKKAFSRLESAVRLTEQRKLSDLEAQGLIQGFEYTHELAWKTLKDFLESQGIVNLYGSRDTTRILPYTIDLSIFKNIRNPEMVEQIERVGIALYKK